MKTLMIELRKEKRNWCTTNSFSPWGFVGSCLRFSLFSIIRKGYLIKFAASSNGHIINTTLWNAHGFKYVWNYCCNMYDL